MSPIDLKQFELDRVINMLRASEWSVISSGFVDEKVSVSFEKSVPGMNSEIKKMEADRITNMLKSFSWGVVGTEFPADKIILKFEKVVKGEIH